MYAFDNLFIVSTIHFQMAKNHDAILGHLVQRKKYQPINNLIKQNNSSVQ